MTRRVVGRILGLLIVVGAVVAGLAVWRQIRVTQDHLYDFSAGVFANALNADTLLISCGGLKTIDLLVPLEAKCRVPVVSSTPHALMNAVRLTGFSPRAMGYGSVLAKA
jgi:arylmalonate decarboxylase